MGGTEVCPLELCRPSEGLSSGPSSPQVIFLELQRQWAPKACSSSQVCTRLSVRSKLPFCAAAVSLRPSGILRLFPLPSEGPDRPTANGSLRVAVSWLGF